jgi:actin-related protein
MARNIVVSGGSSLFPGMMQRLEYELRSLLPYGYFSEP